MSNDKPVDLAYEGITAPQFAKSFRAPKAVSGGESINTYVTTYPNSQSFLADVYLPSAPDAKNKGESLGARLNEAAKDPSKQAHVTAVHTALKQIFEQSRPALSDLRTKFNDTYRGLTEQVKAATPDPDFSYIEIPKYIEDIQETTLAEVKAVQDRELNELNTWLTNPATAPTLAAAFPDTPEEVIKKQLISKMEATHKAQTEAIKKALEKAHEEQFNHLRQDRERINLLRLAAAQSKEIEAQIRNQNARHLSGQTNVSGNAGGDSYAGVDIDQIQGLTTVTGNGSDGHSVSFPANTLTRTLSYILPFLQMLPGPFKDFKEENLQDLIWLAKKIKQSGETTICMTINSDNPNMTQEQYRKLARDCYEACIAAGYKRDEITIKAPNDKHVTKVLCGLDDADKNDVDEDEESKAKSTAKTKRIPPEELFAGGSGLDRLKKIEEMGERVRTAEKDALDPRKTRDHYHGMVEKLRTLGTQQAPAAAPSPMTVRPGP